MLIDTQLDTDKAYAQLGLCVYVVTCRAGFGLGSLVPFSIFSQLITLIQGEQLYKGFAIFTLTIYVIAG